MTNTEAIQTLRANYPDACFEQLREAVDAAIKALKAQNATGDTISRQSAIDVIEEGITYAKAINKETGEIRELFAESNDELRKAVDRVKALPAIDPVKHGDWVYKGARGRFPICECSVCGNAENADWVVIGDSVNYCPRCGARMDGGEG